MLSATTALGLLPIMRSTGTGADVMYLFMEDICGDTGNPPRHARAYGDLAALRRRIREERVAALRAFRADAMNGAFPGKEESVDIDAAELERFLERLETRGASR